MLKKTFKEKLEVKKIRDIKVTSRDFGCKTFLAVNVIK